MAPDVSIRVRDGLFAEPVTSTPSSLQEFFEKELSKNSNFSETVKPSNSLQLACGWGKRKSDLRPPPQGE